MHDEKFILHKMLDVSKINDVFCGILHNNSRGISERSLAEKCGCSLMSEHLSKKLHFLIKTYEKEIIYNKHWRDVQKQCAKFGAYTGTEWAKCEVWIINPAI